MVALNNSSFYYYPVTVKILKIDDINLSLIKMSLHAESLNSAVSLKDCPLN